jgi:hypothetical protein
MARSNSEPGEEPGTCCQDTLKTSVCALPLFPTAEGPVNRHPAPHLTFVTKTTDNSFKRKGWYVLFSAFSCREQLKSAQGVSNVS